MTKEELEYELANASRLAFMSLSDCERDWLIYKKLQEIEENIFELNEKIKGEDI